MQTIKLNGNTEIECTFCAVAFTGDLFIGVKGMDMTGIAQIFSNPNALSRIEFYIDGQLHDTFMNFTRLKNIYLNESDNTFNVGLGRQYA